MSTVSVIVPAHNAAATLGATLDALAHQDAGFEWEVIVVDDGSTDETAAIAANFEPEVTLIRQKKAGPGPARDRGVAAASAAILAFTDADCEPAPDWLREGVAAMDDADLVQGAVRPVPSATRRPFDRTIWVDGRGGLFETANLFVRRELHGRVGGFEDWLKARLGKPLAEDVWFGWRARRGGARVSYCEAALVHHAVFRRSAAEYAQERLRLFYFPTIIKRIPELRQELLVGRLFLNRRTLRFDAALGALGWGLALGTPLPLAAALPYLLTAYRSARPWGRSGPRALAGEVAADCVGLIALVAGSLRTGSPVL